MSGQKEKAVAIRLQGLMSLASAARMVYARATGRHTENMQTLNEVARLIAGQTRIFVLNIDKTAVSVPPEILSAGQFENGGEILSFKDSTRPPIHALAIRRVDLWDAEREVRRLYA